MKLTRRWLVPGTVAVAIAAIVALPHALASTGSPALPGQTAAQLLAAAKSTPVRAFSGTVRVDAALGLPTLPEGMDRTSLGLVGLLSGSHDLRVSADGPDKQRIAVLSGLSETDLVHNGPDLWTYDSSGQAVTHRTLRTRDETTPSPDPSPMDMTPDIAARHLLDKIDPTTEVTTDASTTVAGRDAYVVVLTPRTPDTLIGSVRIALDAENHLPLQVRVVPKGTTDPAVTIGFTSVSFATPSADTFRFSPPAGATVTEAKHDVPTDGGSSEAHPTTSGTGWSAVLELPAAPALTKALTRIGTATPQGHVLAMRLFSVLLTPDGRVFVGAVPPATLESAAGGAR